VHTFAPPTEDGGFGGLRSGQAAILIPPFSGILPGVWLFLCPPLLFGIFDTFPRPVRGGVKGGVKEKDFFMIFTKKAKLQGQGMGGPPLSLQGIDTALLPASYIYSCAECLEKGI
jgi:hypothetical protein